jgi:hypothetical protein
MRWIMMSKIGEYLTGAALVAAALGVGGHMMSQSGRESPDQYIALVNSNGYRMEDLVRNCDPNDELADQNGRVWRAQTAQRAQGGSIQANGQYFVPVSPTVADMAGKGNYDGLPTGCDVVKGSHLDVTKVTDIEERIAELYNNR